MTTTAPTLTPGHYYDRGDGVCMLCSKPKADHAWSCVVCRKPLRMQGDSVVLHGYRDHPHPIRHRQASPVFGCPRPPPPTPQQLQQLVDDAKARIANEAAGRAAAPGQTVTDVVDEAGALISRHVTQEQHK